MTCKRGEAFEIKALGRATLNRSNAPPVRNLPRRSMNPCNPLKDEESK